MNISLNGTKVKVDNRTLAFEKNNLVDEIIVTVDTDDSWSYRIDVQYMQSDCANNRLYNIINLSRDGNICTAKLTSSMLPFAGKYLMQLRGVSGDKVYHTETFEVWVKHSIEPGSTYDPVPSEFYQIEQNIININNHPPYPSDDGYWMIWNVATKEYEKSSIKISAEQGAVRYDAAQDLTPEQQGRARKNIGVSDYTLPVATAETLGGVMPEAKTDDMTSPVGVDSDGRLWVKADGGGSTIDTIPADKVMFESDLIFTEQFGRYKPVDGKVTVPAEEQSLLSVLNDAFSQDKNPTVTQPSVSVSSSTARAYEVGTSVTPAYNGSFNRGAYEYEPSDTGVRVQSWSVKNNVTSETKATQSGTFAAYVVPDGANYKITLSATYSDGAVPYTALGKIYPAGQIKGATKTVTSGAITGYRNSLYGTLITKPESITSDIVRSLAQKSGRSLANGSTFTVNVPIGAMCVLICYPATLRELTFVKDVNGLNADITAAFSQIAVNVAGANGYNAISYRVYRLDFASPNDAANTYSVKI